MEANINRNNVDLVLSEIENKSKDIYGDKLKKIILYGSYARNEYDQESDIDVMLLVDIPKEEIRKYKRIMSEIITDIDLKYNVVLSIKETSYSEFNYWLGVLPFYNNVQREGITIYGQ